jgi:hypothetical protein
MPRVIGVVGTLVVVRAVLLVPFMFFGRHPVSIMGVFMMFVVFMLLV